jgi:hypothetical protein
MQNPFKKPKIAAPGNGIYRYHRGEEFNNGAQEMAFDWPFALPSLLFRGAGRLAGTLNVLPGNQQEYNYQVTPIGLSGLPAGFYYQQPLITQEPTIEGTP